MRAPVQPREAPPPPARGPARVTKYGFEDESGRVVARLIRFDPVDVSSGERKGFMWQHRSGAGGGWVSGKPPGGVSLYRLSAVKAAVAAGARIWLVEGCKNADQLGAVLPPGEVATTPPDGGASWRDEYAQVLAGATVTVVADRDEPGYRHAAQVATSLRRAGVVLRLVRTPLNEEHGDASDHLDAGLGLEEFEEVPAVLLKLPVEPELAVSGGGGVEEEVELSGVASARVAELDEKRQDHGFGLGAEKKRKLSAAQALLKLALEHWEPICSEGGESYLIPREGPRIARLLREGSPLFSAELAALYYEQSGRVAGHYALIDCLLILQGIAERGPRVRLHRRVARYDDGLVLDLGDETGRAVVITSAGWEVRSVSPVLFWRTTETEALPVPVRGGDVSELWSLVHVDPADRGLAEAELVFRYFADVSHPILSLSGEAGAGKTTAAVTLASLIDPAPVVSQPKDIRDWAVRVSQSYSPVLDNLRGLTEWQSDALCMAVTGGEISFRTLHTNRGVTSFGGQQCVTLTSVDLGAQAADLVTRMLPIRLNRFRGGRIGEDAHREAREEALPRLLGAVLDRVSGVLRVLPRVRSMPLDLPRLSGFAQACKALDVLDVDAGLPSADRFGAYARLLNDQAGDIADEDEVAAAVTVFMADRVKAGQGAWEGRPSDLHAVLTPGAFRSRYWPATAAAFSKRLYGVLGPLRAAGIEVVRGEGRSASRRQVTIRCIPQPGVSDSGVIEMPATEDVEQPSPAGVSSRHEPAPAAEELPLMGADCDTCKGPGPVCGQVTVATEVLPCVLCGAATVVRAPCGTPRHAHCTPREDDDVTTPDPLPVTHEVAEAGPRGASTTPAAPGTASGSPVPRASDTPAPSPSADRRRSGRSDRRGLHLYGVLCGEGFTIVADRRAGPTEPWDGDRPSSLRAAVSFARKLNCEALWIHTSALESLGLDPETRPEGVDGWSVDGRGEPDQLEVAIPEWMTGTGSWADPQTGRELAAALAEYEAAIGMRFRAGPAATAMGLLGMLHKRTGAAELTPPSWHPPREVTNSERELLWARPLTEQERSARWIIGVDKHGAYPGCMSDLRLGLGDPIRHEGSVCDPKTPGMHRITGAAPPEGRDPLLPDALIGVARGGEWRSTETVRLIQAPSGKCVEDESDDCRDCRFKCGVGPPVVCVENFPRFDMGDDSFDGGACVVEALVECFLPVEKFPAGWFFERGEHAAPDVSFIADRGYVARWSRAPDWSRQYRSCREPGVGSEIHDSCPSRVAATWTTTPVVRCLPDHRPGTAAHDQQGSKVPSMMYCRSARSSSAVGTTLRSACASNGVTPAIARLTVDCDTP